MKSPRFDVRSADLRDIFSPTNIERIWTKKVRVFMRQQFINDGIENFDFHIFRKIESKKLSDKILSGQYIPQKAQRILVEKSKGLCRQIVIPSVQDAIVLQCLSDSLYPDVRRNAPSKRSFFEPKEHKFSSKRDGYGTFAAWIKFQKELFSFSKERPFIVVTDIANYYDTINYIHLRNALSPASGAAECVLDMLIYVLSDLLWQPDYTPRLEVGLPQINLDAPRLLAHCFLYELDSFLESDKLIDFVRYMDDIDIGTDTIVKAKTILRDVDLVLQTKHVRLNSGKTRILTRAEARRHFRILDNYKIDIVKTRVDNRIKNGKSVDRDRKLVQLRIKQGIKKNDYNDGNGEKILKRWIGLAVILKSHIDTNIIESIIKLRPSCRENILSYIRVMPLIPTRAAALARCTRSGLLTDDASIVDIANYLVETKVHRKWKITPIVDELIIGCDNGSFFGFYSAAWLKSKYTDLSELLVYIDKNQHIWAPDERLGRIVAAFRPLFSGSSEEKYYEHLMFISNNNGVRDVLRFHHLLSTDGDAFNYMYNSLKNPNPSRGTGITHSKFLCLLSALSNNAAPKKGKQVLVDNNHNALSDVYYRKIADRLKLI